MSQVRSIIQGLAHDDKGLETVEYAVMTALIVAAIVVALVALAGAITGRMGATETVIEGI